MVRRRLQQKLAAEVPAQQLLVVDWLFAFMAIAAARFDIGRRRSQQRSHALLLRIAPACCVLLLDMA